MNTRPSFCCCWLPALALVLQPAAWAVEFPAPAPYAGYAAKINLGDYRARKVLVGVRLRWEGGYFIDANEQRYTPPDWFADGFPAAVLDGQMVAAHLDNNAIGRIMRATGADEGWRKLTFIALDLPDADGGFDERLVQLQKEVEQANLPNLSTTAWRQFTDADALQTALDAMYKDGGDGYLLQHRAAAYDADVSRLLLALPYALGEAVVLAHRAGRGQYTGLMGSLEVADEAGGEFVIATGFTREQRRQPPPVGARIAFKYKGFTATGKPKNPVFLHMLPAAEKKIGGVVRTIHLMWLFIAMMLLLAAMDAATHTAGGRKWNFKSAIVSTGLLGTFVGVFWGLYNFDTTDIAAGVPALLEGLKLAFATSIVGIGLSTMLSVVQTILGNAD